MSEPVSRPPTRRQPGACRRAFTLIELLVVVLIIALIIAILLPALGSARQAARMAETQTLLTDLSNAFAQFSTDNRRNPGLFSEQLMGAGNNAGPNGGLTALQNAMLELAGGIVPNDNDNAIDDEKQIPIIIPVSPGSPSDSVFVNWKLIGAATSAGSSVYFAPRERYYNSGEMGHHHGLQGNPLYRIGLPNLIDAWGTPILLWSRDPAASGRIVLPDSGGPSGGNPGPGEVAFARENSNQRALFYWNSNWAALSSNSLGRLRTDVSADSALGEGRFNANQRAVALAALLGSPTFPGNLSGGNLAEIVPTAPRGDYVLMSAGGDGVFLGRNDRRGRGFASQANGLPRYGDMFAGVEAGADTSDIVAAFDDMVVSGGN